MRTLSAMAFLLMMVGMAPARAQSGLKTETIVYNHGQTILEGFMAWDPAVAGKRQGVLVVHEWRGHGAYARRRAEQLARLGYLAFALDMYGKGVFAKDHEEAGKLAGVYFGDRTKMRERALAGLEVLKKHEMCDATRLGAMGYCFGGTTSLELARAGADLRGVVSFHGNLSAPQPAESGKVKARVLVCHGADDRFIPAEQVAAFQEEMRNAKVDWQLVAFGGAVHSFTVAEAGNDPSKGMAYDEKADRRSWEMMKDFWAECLGR
ncbi:MAG: dienelactone hydrolase family protein [Planctomycetales bacterium]|nr:dienelactone hydrolase family protein [Planctomycetales bacterium]